MDIKQHASIKILKTFSKDEIQDFKKFLSSPYFNTNQNISKIFDELIKYYPEFNSEKLTKENTYKKIFKDKAYNDSNMRWLMSVLHHHIENFLSQKAFDNDKPAKLRYLAKENLAAMRKDAARKSMDDMKKLLDEEKYKGYLYYFYKYIYYTNEGSYDILFNNDRKKKDTDIHYGFFLKAIVAYINHFTLGIAYDYMNMDMNASKYYKNGIAKKINSLMKELKPERLSEIIRNDNEDRDDVEMDMKLFTLLLNFDNDELYYDFSKYIKEKAKCLNINDLRSYYSKMISYCWKKILIGKNENYYREELHRISEIFVNGKCYKSDSVPWIAHTLFRIFLLNSLALGKQKFVTMLSKELVNEVYPQQKKNVKFFSDAVINLYERNYDAALSSLSKMESSFLNIDQKALRIILFIKKKYLIECCTEIKSFKKFLQSNHSLSDQTKQGYKNFLFFAETILKNIMGKSEIPEAGLRKKMKLMTSVYYKDFVEKFLLETAAG